MEVRLKRALVRASLYGVAGRRLLYLYAIQLISHVKDVTTDFHLNAHNCMFGTASPIKLATQIKYLKQTKDSSDGYQYCVLL